MLRLATTPPHPARLRSRSGGPTSPRTRGEESAFVARLRVLSPIQFSNSQASSPVFFARPRVRRRLVSAPPRGERSAEKRRGLRGPFERLARPPDTLARRALPACAAESRLSALHMRRSHLGAGPRFARGPRCPAVVPELAAPFGSTSPSGARASLHGPPSASSWQGPVVVPGGAPAPPECGVRTPPAGAASAFKRSARSRPERAAGASPPARRPPLRLRYVPRRRPSSSGTRSR